MQMQPMVAAATTTTTTITVLEQGRSQFPAPPANETAFLISRCHFCVQCISPHGTSRGDARWEHRPRPLPMWRGRGARLAGSNPTRRRGNWQPAARVGAGRGTPVWQKGSAERRRSEPREEQMNADEEVGGRQQCAHEAPASL